MMNKKQKIILKKLGSSILVVVILCFDQITKFLIRNSMVFGESKKILGFFSLTFLKNTGISFGLFKGSNILFTIISFLALLFFTYVYFKKKKYSLQLSLIIAGITGNLIDRIVLGYVVDFIDFHYWPVFNIADSAVSIGMIWLLILLVKNNDDLI